MVRLVVLGLILMSAGARVQPAPGPGPGVSLQLAEERAARVTDLSYELHFAVPASQSDAVTGRVTLRFQLKDASRPLALDFAAPEGAVSAGVLNGRQGKPRYEVDHLVIAPADLREGRNEITLEFRSADGPLNRNPEFIYALFVPARARQAFPCFDQPDLKARYRLSLDVPPGWEALSNGPEEAESEGATRRFAATQPIPTYLFTFAAGKFQIETAERNGRRFRMLHRETDAAKVARNKEAIFDLHAGALAWLESYTGIPYPFGKFDFLLVPSFQFGGMEHPGSVFYNASALLLDESATQNQKLGRASLIAHETAHMWFGDLVTMRWFNDVWMKEVFANFMAAKIVNPAFPEINHELRFLYAHYPAAYDVDRTAGTNAIRQRLDNLDEAGSLYGAIIYQKAPVVMRHLELLLGEATFKEGMREYLKTYAFGNATWPELIAILDRRTADDLAEWSHAWVEEAGRPTIRTELKVGEAGLISLAFVQEDPYESRGLLWTQPLSVAIGYQRDGIAAKGRITGRQFAPAIAPPGSAAPVYVLPNNDGVSYANFILDPGSRAHLLAHLPDDEVARGSALVILWEEMIDGRVAPPAMFDTLLAALPGERNELTIQRMLSYTQQAYWKWLPASQRAARAVRLEGVLRAGLDAAKTTSIKSAWFNALRDTAVTPATLAWLERVWRKEETVPGLVLAEPDFITLAQELAVRGVQNAEQILAGQIARTQNPDRKARMEFVRPSLSADEAVRDSFFARLKEAANRRREAWVLEGLGYLHHPLRSASAEKHVRPSLVMLREIQRTGDIFFPKRWMDATLSGHTNPAIAREVTTFVAELPAGYPDRLRRTILSAADDLLRLTRPGR